uniref:(California timema) hypothetical protein n=1 Tax=Timema californicum TaxID=61474 RepID=A0A7R9J1F1_TIMCA|nr:unnamed protein product [Timema californicum]
MTRLWKDDTSFHNSLNDVNQLWKHSVAEEFVPIKMKLWVKTSMLLCLFGFLKEFRPSEPYLIQYLTGPWLNFTEEKVNQDMLPVGTYSYISCLIVILLITDILRYKPIIVLEGFTGIVAAEAVWGLFAATEVAYFTYIYATVDRQHYQKVTSHIRAAFLLGHSLSAVVAQTLSLLGVMDAHTLTYITAGALSLSTIWAILLPNVKKSIYFHREDKTNSEDSDDRIAVTDTKDVASPVPSKKTFTEKCVIAYKFLKKDFLAAYTNLYVVKWSIWWGLGAGCYLQAYGYNQMVYEVILKESGELETAKYNGAVEAISSLLGAAVAFGCGFLRFDWTRVGDVFLGLGCVAVGVMLYVFAVSESIWLGYSGYSMFVILFNGLITITTAEVARNISEDSYGLIFGVNTLLTLLVQTLITLVVVSSTGLALGPRQQRHSQPIATHLSSVVG